jgi:hypothetical protein
LEQFMGPALGSASADETVPPANDIIAGSPEHLGLHY